MKKIVGIILVITAATMITGCGKEKKEETTNKKEQEEVKVNTNEEVIKDQKVDVFEIKNTSLIYENGNSKLETTVTNTSDETVYLSEFKIYVKDKEGNEIITLTGFVGDSLAAGETRTINSYYGQDLSNAASISYEIVR